MKSNERFCVAVHILVYLSFNKEQYSPSQTISESVNTNAVVIRRILSTLQKGGLVEIKRGAGGAKLARAAKNITLFDIYNAVNPPSIINLHTNVNTKCLIGANINTLLSSVLKNIDNAVSEQLSKQTVADIAQGLTE